MCGPGRAVQPQDGSAGTRRDFSDMSLYPVLSVLVLVSSTSTSAVTTTTATTTTTTAAATATYAQTLTLVNLILVNFFGFLVITRDHGSFEGRH